MCQNRIVVERDITIVTEDDVVACVGGNGVGCQSTDNYITSGTGGDCVIAMIVNDRGVTGYVC